VNWLARRCYQHLAKRKGRLRFGTRWYQVLSRPDNAPVAAAVSAHPQRFVGFAYVNPTEPDHLGTALSLLAEGFKGVQVNAWLEGFDVARDLYPLARLCGERGYPVHIQLGGTHRTGWSLVELADRLPATNFIIAHAGLPYGPSLWQAARTRPNLYFDLAPPFVDERLLEVVARRVPPGRLIFASGGAAGLRTPEGDYSYRVLMARMRNLPLGGRARKAVMGENLRRLLEAGRLERELRARLWACASGSPDGR
jgi:predicted TIM-barrel fold metal-dependent hydrolase